MHMFRIIHDNQFRENRMKYQENSKIDKVPGKQNNGCYSKIIPKISKITIPRIPKILRFGKI